MPVRKIFPPWLVLIVLAMLAFALLGDRGVLRALQSYHHKQELEQQLAEIKFEQQRLREEIRRLRKDRDYWEQLARKELGMVREGELIYQLPDAEKPQK